MIPEKEHGVGVITRRNDSRAYRRWRSVAHAGVVAVVALALASCNSLTSSTRTSGIVRAVGAESQYANLISQIGGRYVSVAAIMSNPSTDPHTFEVSTSVAQTLASAQLVVQNGLGYDAFMNQLESASPSSSRRVIEVQTLLGLPNSTKNPHLWYDPSFMVKVASQIETDLASAAPSHAKYFATRLAAFQTSMQTLDVTIRAFRARFAGTAVATTEPVADYLLTTLGLKNETPFRFQADIMNGVDPSPEDIAFQQRLFTTHRVAMFCYNAQVNSSVTLSLRSIAEAARVPVVAVYETMPTPGYDYQTWMAAEISAMTRALVTKTSTKGL